LEMQARLGRFDLSGSLTYVHDKYNEFETETAPGVYADLTASQFAQAPKISSTATVNYHVPVDETVAGDLSVGVTWAYQSKIYFHDFNEEDPGLPNILDSINADDGYGLWNAQLVARDLFGRQGLGAS